MQRSSKRRKQKATRDGLAWKQMLKSLICEKLVTISNMWTMNVIILSTGYTNMQNINTLSLIIAKNKPKC